MDRRLAHVLEAGRFAPSLAARAVAGAWAHVSARSLVRPGVVDPRIAVVSVGGATLGGSGKTRVAVACARLLAELGARVALVGHAYRARPGLARVVDPADSLADVGDEALASARALVGTGARVVVAPRRQAALDHAARGGADVLVVDGPLRLRAVGPSLALLAVDRDTPWGAGHVPPAGDLRAPVAALLAEADHVVAVDPRPTRLFVDGASHDLAWLAGRSRPVGLFTALARPDRLVRALAAAGLTVARHVSVADHGPCTPRATAELRDSSNRRDSALWGWLATDKCAVHLEVLAPVPLGILRSEVALPPAVVECLRRLA